MNQPQHPSLDTLTQGWTGLKSSFHRWRQGKSCDVREGGLWPWFLPKVCVGRFALYAEGSEEAWGHLSLLGAFPWYFVHSPPSLGLAWPA